MSKTEPQVGDRGTGVWMQVIHLQGLREDFVFTVGKGAPGGFEKRRTYIRLAERFNIQC